MAELNVEPGKGVAFRNDKKGNDKAPDWRLTINVDGAIKEVALWERTSKSGSEYMSALVGDPRPRQDAPKKYIPSETEDVPFN